MFFMINILFHSSDKWELRMKEKWRIRLEGDSFEVQQQW